MRVSCCVLLKVNFSQHRDDEIQLNTERTSRAAQKHARQEDCWVVLYGKAAATLRAKATVLQEVLSQTEQSISPSLSLSLCFSV